MPEGYHTFYKYVEHITSQPMAQNNTTRNKRFEELNPNYYDESVNKLFRRGDYDENYAFAVYYWFHYFSEEHESIFGENYADRIDSLILEKYPKLKKELDEIKPQIKEKGFIELKQEPEKRIGSTSTAYEKIENVSKNPDNSKGINGTEKRPPSLETTRPPIRFRPTQASKENPFHEAHIKYQGRDKEQEHLEDFVRHKDFLKVWAISGPSGSGKTRLAHQWMQESQAMQGWDQIILGSHDRNRDHKPEFWEEWIPIYPTLLVIDYLYVYTDAFHTILNRCLSLEIQELLPYPVRILLIDHIFPKTLDQLSQDKRMRFSSMRIDEYKPLFFNNGNPLDLKEIEDRDTIIPLILREAAGVNVDEKTIQKALSHLKSMEKQGAWYPLFAIITGDSLKRAEQESQNIDVTSWNRRHLIKYYMSKNTRLLWELDGNEVDGAYASAFIATATARRGADFKLMKQYKPNHPKAVDVNYN